MTPANDYWLQPKGVANNFTLGPDQAAPSVRVCVAQGKANNKSNWKTICAICVIRFRRAPHVNEANV